MKTSMAVAVTVLVLSVLVIQSEAFNFVPAPCQIFERMLLAICDHLLSYNCHSFPGETVRRAYCNFICTLNLNGDGTCTGNCIA